MGSPERPQENAAAKPEAYTDPLELWRALQAQLDGRNLSQTALAQKIGEGIGSPLISETLKKLLEGHWPVKPMEQKALALMAEHLGISYSAPAVVAAPASYKHRVDGKPPQNPRGGPAAPRQYRTSR